MIHGEETERAVGPTDEPLVIAGRTLTAEEGAAVREFLKRHDDVMAGLRRRPLPNALVPVPRPSAPSDRAAKPR